MNPILSDLSGDGNALWRRDCPARVRKPKDKAKAEVGVQIVERWILAALRNTPFFSLTELNQTIQQLY